jgi:hypothetical protein
MELFFLEVHWIAFPEEYKNSLSTLAPAIKLDLLDLASCDTKRSSRNQRQNGSSRALRFPICQSRTSKKGNVNAESPHRGIRMCSFSVVQ